MVFHRLEELGDKGVCTYCKQMDLQTKHGGEEIRKERGKIINMIYYLPYYLTLTAHWPLLLGTFHPF